MPGPDQAGGCGCPHRVGDQIGDFLRDVGGWVRDGKLKYKEDFIDGLENAPQGLIGLLQGKNFGKLVVRVSLDPAA